MRTITPNKSTRLTICYDKVRPEKANEAACSRQAWPGPNVLHCRTVDNNSVGMRDLGQNVSRELARVKKGESLVVTEYGRPVARLVPYAPARTLEELVESGEATPPSGDLQEFLKRFAEEPPVISSVPLSQILQEMRDDERW